MYTVTREIEGYSKHILLNTTDLDEAIKLRNDKEKIWSWAWCARFSHRFGAIPVYRIEVRLK